MLKKKEEEEVCKNFQAEKFFIKYRDVFLHIELTSDSLASMSCCVRFATIIRYYKQVDLSVHFGNYSQCATKDAG